MERPKSGLAGQNPGVVRPRYEGLSEKVGNSSVRSEQ